MPPDVQLPARLAFRPVRQALLPELVRSRAFSSEASPALDAVSDKSANKKPRTKRGFAVVRDDPALKADGNAHNAS
jgi:hypothetical protein